MQQMPKWNQMPDEQKEEIVTKYLEVLKEKMMKSKQVTVSSNFNWSLMEFRNEVVGEEVTFEFGYY